MKELYDETEGRIHSKERETEFLSHSAKLNREKRLKKRTKLEDISEEQQ